MNLMDFLFPQASAASHLRALRSQQTANQSFQAESARLDRLSDEMLVKALRQRIDDLEGDLGFVVLVLASLLARLETSETLSRAEVLNELKSIDPIDGKDDGRLSIRVLKQILAGID